MICVPIVAKNTEEALHRIAKANMLADILEIRLDMMDRFDLQKMIQSTSKPVLATYRSIREGGQGTADHETHVSYLLSAIEGGAKLVDVERSLPRKWRERIFRGRGKSNIIISTHILDQTPSREALEEILKKMSATGADIIKIVTHAKSMRDNLRVLDLIPQAHEEGIQIIAFCMGPLGRISRIFSHLMGAYMTFASLERGQESADGQLAVVDMKRILDMFKSEKPSVPAEFL
jgi:3-dehydroquinate dehydratase type I